MQLVSGMSHAVYYSMNKQANNKISPSVKINTGKNALRQFGFKVSNDKPLDFIKGRVSVFIHPLKLSFDIYVNDEFTCSVPLMAYNELYKEITK